MLLLASSSLVGGLSATPRTAAQLKGNLPGRASQERLIVRAEMAEEHCNMQPGSMLSVTGKAIYIRTSVKTSYAKFNCVLDALDQPELHKKGVEVFVLMQAVR